MTVQCENCISLAICIHQINFERDDHYSFGYVFEWGNCIHRCSYLSNLSKGTHNDPEFFAVKLFFMKQKGVNPVYVIGSKM